MDRSLDEIIVDHQRARSGRGRGGRLNEGPRDGIRKPRSRETRQDIDKDWVHDRYEDDQFSTRPPRNNRFSPAREDRDSVGGTRIRVENLHYELTERDVNELFSRIGPVSSCQLLYDRADRSRGIAFISYEDPRDANDAVREFDGANAYGQPIRLSLMPAGPSGSSAPARNARTSTSVRSDRGAGGRSLFDRVEAPRRARSSSPHRRRGPGPAPDHVDRYTPSDIGSRDRSPPRRRGGGGRRPGEKREGGVLGGRGRRGPPKDDQARPFVQGRPRKTADELDAEMTDYFAKDSGANNSVGNGGTMNGAAELFKKQGVEQPNASAPAGGAEPTDEDIDMIE